jgi:hypothetical protein
MPKRPSARWPIAASGSPGRPAGLPIAIQVPWGVSPALLPEIPLPTKIRTAFGDPIELDADPEPAEDERYVKSMYREIGASIQGGMDALARRRRLPLFG